MKKLLGVSVLALMLAACSTSSNDRPQPPQGQQGQGQSQAQGPQGQPPHNEKLEAAMKECHSQTDKASTSKKTKSKKAKANKASEAAFESCMKQKGFEKPADHPQGPAPQQNQSTSK